MNSIFTSNGLDNNNEMTSSQEEGLLPIGHLVTGRNYIYIRSRHAQESESSVEPVSTTV